MIPYQENDETQLYIQPSSLAILYWAARKMNLPYSDTPQNFLANHDWSDPHWFGGLWGRSQQEAKHGKV